MTSKMKILDSSAFSSSSHQPRSRLKEGGTRGKRKRKVVTISSHRRRHPTSSTCTPTSSLRFFSVHADVVNLPSSPSESASSFQSGNISSFWVQFQYIPVGKSIQFKFVLKDSTGNMLWQPGPDRIFQTWETENTITICEDWENVEYQK
ncbi:hypothetical protein LWI29_018402 [Acer saccharum]|uniref:CBM20 domain-containing protein n=1 Tax=Acer saccharum TaxID=4024 RepID=A0AA39S276_ACESA|nr:hypothetical protein LWI29_018402 [Acer saccharum]